MRRLFITSGLLVVLLGTVQIPVGADGAVPKLSPCDPDGWVVSWGTSQARQGPSHDDVTLRQIVTPHLSGDSVRVRFAHRFGTQPAVLRNVTVGTVADGASLDAASVTPLTFGGQSTVTIGPGEVMQSDPADLAVTAFDHVAVSFHLPESSGPSSVHPGGAGQGFTAYRAQGDVTAVAAGDPFMADGMDWTYVTGLDVQAAEPTPTVVALGDSITDGAVTTPDANQTWPDHLARRIQALPESEQFSVVNMGVSGGRVLHDGAGWSALRRLEEDVLDQPGIRAAIVFKGINDIGYPSQLDDGTRVSSSDIINGYIQIISRLNQRGIMAIGATLTPSGDLLEPSGGVGNRTMLHYSHPESNVRRHEVNDWIRTSGAFNAVVDFDAAIHDGVFRDRMADAYDSGDHLHPGDAGMAAIAAAIDLTALPISC